MAQLIPTHINAYYDELLTAKQIAAAANAKVTELEDYIRGHGGTVPGEEEPGGVPAPSSEPEDTASSNDVSAAEEKPSNNPFKKGTK